MNLIKSKLASAMPIATIFAQPAVAVLLSVLS